MNEPRAHRAASFRPTPNTLYSALDTSIIRLNKTRQGYARERILKPAGYFFVRGDA